MSKNKDENTQVVRAAQTPHSKWIEEMKKAHADDSTVTIISKMAASNDYGSVHKVGEGGTPTQSDSLVVYGGSGVAGIGFRGVVTPNGTATQFTGKQFMAAINNKSMFKHHKNGFLSFTGKTIDTRAKIEAIVQEEMADKDGGYAHTDATLRAAESSGKATASAEVTTKQLDI